MATCPSCGNYFIPRRTHHWQCFPCWRRNRQIPEDSDPATLELRRLRRRVLELEAELIEKREAKPALNIPMDMLRRLLQLCHPDRHADSEAATKATRWLLEQRKELL